MSSAVIGTPSLQRALRSIRTQTVLRALSIAHSEANPLKK